MAVGWINIYRSGFYHSEGKPDAFNRHAGEVYPQKHVAEKHIDPASHYVATILIEWDDPAITLRGNPEDSVPIPLSLSRKREFVAHRREYENA